MKMRIHVNTTTNKTISTIFLTLLIALAITGYSYSHWMETIHIQGTITTGTWGAKTASVRIMKTLNGSFTNPYTGDDVQTPTNLTHVGTATNPGWPTKFQLIITVQNNGTVDTDNMVADVILNPVEPINYTASQGTVEWYKNITYQGEYVKNFLNWTIGILHPNEQATLEIWIQTVRNPSKAGDGQGFYEPTSENQPLEINSGAKIKATSELGSLEATTEAITLYIVDTDMPDDPNIAVITPTLPYSTPWTSDSITE
ncbi:MAG: hypothetical protein QXX51_07770 [Candidatus Bathyarchaeia archaeon]